MGNLTQEQLAALIANVVGQVLAGQSPKATAKPHFLPKGSRADAGDLASKDARIAATFARRGFQVTLKDRNHPNKPFDVKPFKAWVAEGRVPRKGSKSVRGLFHITQCDLIAKPTGKAVKGKAKAA